ncbi:LCP family protein [Glutamicibacter sp. FBE19]|uniref:LCP family protein n=1 Tax=Glutamicibacter sp. FBE19 TaxID=2761534 RepID=UPI0018969D07|nr:LCP family protein [Glutamicibacter sp. FBE19]MBF6670274.1 LCP family protein [Glutamicibacter sp. FBE19]
MTELRIRPHRRRITLLLVFALVIALVVAASGLWFKLQGNISTASMRSSESAAPDSSHGLNLLLLGSDTRDLEASGFGKGSGARSDSMVLVHVAAGNRRIDAVQIPRDTLVDMPACDDTGHGSFSGGVAMINSALNYGPACSVAAVEALTGVQLNHFIEINFEGFISIVDALGGVDVCLPQPMKDPKAKLDLPAGDQKVNGTDALALARTRHAVGDGSDIARLGHQQMVMSAIVQQATSRETLARPDRLYSFLDAATSSLTVDPGLSSLSDLTALAARAQAVPSDDITFMTMPWSPAPQNRNRVVPSADAESLFASLREDSPVALAGTKSGKKSDADAASEINDRAAAVHITNAARVANLAGDYAKKASEQGYTVSGVGNAASVQGATTLLAADTDQAQQTAMALAKDLNLDLKPVTAAIDGVQLHLGQDYQSVEKPEKSPVKTTNRKASQSLCG